MRDRDRPVLIYRLGSLGDTVVALPCFHAIERAFAGRRRLVITNVPVSSKAAALEAVLRPGRLIDGVIDYPVGLRSIRGAWRLIRAIRATGARTLVYLTPPRGLKAVRRDLLFFRLCGIRAVIGAPTTPDLQRNRPGAGGGDVEPEAERLARCLATLGPIDLADRAGWDLRLTAAEHAAGDAALAPLAGRDFVAINMGGKLAANDWGDDRWAALIEAIGPTLAGLGLVSVGGAEDAARATALLARWPGPTANLCGTLKPRESAAVLGRARVFVGHDSGPMHLAAAMGTMTLGLFGDANPPRKWHPYGPGNRALHDMRGVRAIAVAQVQAALLAMIDARAIA